ncbi:unnamed protein product [Closterium sp. NIES-54]
MCLFLTCSSTHTSCRGLITAVAAAVAIVWCTRTAASLLVAIVPQADDVRALIAFMCIVAYFCFALLVLF